MKSGKKCAACVLVMLVMLLCCACKEYVDRGPEAEEMAKEYIAGKYGDALSYTGIHEWRTAIINADPYWEVYFTDKEGEEFTVCICLSEDDELYIDYETYYNHYIEPMMCEWLETYLREAGLKEYTFYSAGGAFSPDWSVDYGVDEVLENLMEGEKTKRGRFLFYLKIPERERDIYDSGKLVQSLGEVRQYSQKIVIDLYIYEDEIYDSWDKMQGHKSSLESVNLLEEDANE